MKFIRDISRLFHTIFPLRIFFQYFCRDIFAGITCCLHQNTECPCTRHLFRGKEYFTLRDVFTDEDICILLHKVCKVLKITVWMRSIETFCDEEVDIRYWGWGFFTYAWCLLNVWVGRILVQEMLCCRNISNHTYFFYLHHSYF